MVNLLCIQRVNSASHGILLLLFVLSWLLIFVWSLPANVSRLLAYKASPLVLVAFSSMELPTIFTLWNGTLALVHFLVLFPFRASFLPLAFPQQLSTSRYRGQRLLSKLTCLNQSLVLPDLLSNHQVLDLRSKSLFESLRLPRLIRLVLKVIRKSG